jgi:hypothetical protein
MMKKERNYILKVRYYNIKISKNLKAQNKIKALYFYNLLKELKKDSLYKSLYSYSLE